MKKIRNYLNSSYPVLYQRWKTSLISCIIVFLILVLFQPFGISSIEHHKYAILLGYMVVTGMFLCIPVYLLPLLFPRFYDDKRWTVGRQIINQFLIFFFIAIGLWLYSDRVFEWGLRWDIFCSFLIASIVVGIFPFVFFIMLNRNRLLAMHLREAVEMNEHLRMLHGASCNGLEEKKEKEEEETTRIVFSGGTKESLEIPASDLLYVEAEGNYVKIAYLKEERCAQKLLRATIKQAEEVTANFPSIIKCHRAFLINLRHVSKVNGNSQGYRLSLSGSEEEIPVSRAYSKGVKKLIESMNNR